MTLAPCGYSLLLPTKLTSRAAEVFASQVVLAASVAKVQLELIPEGADHVDMTLAKDYSLPVLVAKEGGGSNLVLFTSRAAVLKLIDEDPLLLSAHLEALTIEDFIDRLTDAVTNNSLLDTLFFSKVNMPPASKASQVIMGGLIHVLLRNGEGDTTVIPSNVIDWYKEFTLAHQEALNSIESLLLPTPHRRVKDGIAFEYDWTVERTPKSNTRNILITSALPYVNNVPHLGNIIGAVLSADVFARYCRLRGYQTIYICGTDEYGTATETKALEENISCPELCAKYYKLHSAIYDWFGIKTDIFGRSSTEKQTAITHEIFNGLYKNGYFFEQAVEQTFCTTCSRFLADRYVEGVCPLCGYGDARGDQCDGCGKLLNPTELKDPHCKICRSTPIVRSSNHLFLDLTKLQSICEEFVEKQSVSGHWSPNSMAISKAWLTEGLKPRCMTRDLRWGTPVPLAGFEEKVFYVWFDACFGYISITANYTEEWRQWWQCNDTSDGQERPKVELFQFMGKDNVPFHTVIFPSTLLGTVAPDSNGNCPWTLLHHISTTEYLNYETGKFSKSRGVGVFGNDARDSGIPVAYWRYYLLSTRPETTDATFSWEDFGARSNNELLANLGNFVSRVSKFAMAKFGGKVPPIESLTESEMTLIQKVNLELNSYLESMEGVHLRNALKSLMTISSFGNQYLTESSLDNRLLASNPGRCGTIIAVALNLVYLLSALLDPFIPTTAIDMRRILNAPPRQIPDTFDVEVLLAGHVIGQPFHLFTRIDEVRLGELQSKFSGKQVK